jgi:hypothetical protein
MADPKSNDRLAITGFVLLAAVLSAWALSSRDSSTAASTSQPPALPKVGEPAVMKMRCVAFDSEALADAHAAARADDKTVFASIVTTRGTHIEAGEQVSILASGVLTRRVEHESGAWWLDVDCLQRP